MIPPVVGPGRGGRAWYVVGPSPLLLETRRIYKYAVEAVTVDQPDGKLKYHAFVEFEGHMSRAAMKALFPECACEPRKVGRHDHDRKAIREGLAALPGQAVQAMREYGVRPKKEYKKGGGASAPKAPREVSRDALVALARQTPWTPEEAHVLNEFARSPQNVDDTTAAFDRLKAAFGSANLCTAKLIVRREEVVAGLTQERQRQRAATFM